MSPPQRQEKISQLSPSNNDLHHLPGSIEVAAIFSDRDSKIKLCKPAATNIFNLILSDLDRPVAHLTKNIIYNELVAAVKPALKTLGVKAFVVQ